MHACVWLTLECLTSLLNFEVSLSKLNLPRNLSASSMSMQYHSLNDLQQRDSISDTGSNLFLHAIQNIIAANF